MKARAKEMSQILSIQTPNHYLPGTLRAKERMNSCSLFPSLCRRSSSSEQSLLLRGIFSESEAPQCSGEGKAAAPLPFCHYTTALTAIVYAARNTYLLPTIYKPKAKPLQKQLCFVSLPAPNCPSADQTAPKTNEKH